MLFLAVATLILSVPEISGNTGPATSEAAYCFHVFPMRGSILSLSVLWAILNRGNPFEKGQVMGRMILSLILILTPSLWAQNTATGGQSPAQTSSSWAVRADTPLPTTAPTDGRNYYYITQETAFGDQWFVLLAPSAQAAVDLLRRSGKVEKDAKLRTRRITHAQAMELFRDANTAAELEATAMERESGNQATQVPLMESESWRNAFPRSQARMPETRPIEEPNHPRQAGAPQPKGGGNEASEIKPKGHIPSPDTIVRVMPRQLLAKPAEQETELDRLERSKWVQQYCIGRTISLIGVVEDVKREGDHYSVIVSGTDGSPRCTVRFCVVFEFTMDAKAMLMKVCAGDEAKFTGWIERIMSGADTGYRHKDGIMIEVWLSDCRLQNISAPPVPGVPSEPSIRRYQLDIPRLILRKPGSP